MTPILIDSNLLTLLVVGETGRANIANHKRLQAYTAQDYDAVGRLTRPPRPILACAHVFAETSNLVRLTPEPLRTLATRTLGALIKQIVEPSQTSLAAVVRREFSRVGLTDAVLLTLAATEGALLSDDLQLCLIAEAAGYPVINYNHLRDGAVAWADLPL